MNQFNKIYFNGCSYTAGGGLEIPSEEDSYAVWPIKGYKEIMDVYWKHHKEVAYPQRVSDELDVEVINKAQQGGSWNRIVRMFWEYVSNNSELNTLFVLEYPGGLRDEFFSTKLNDYIKVNTNMTTEMILESFENTGGQRNYKTLKSNEDKNVVYEPLKNYYKHLFNPDCVLHFKKEIISMYGIMLHCENNKIPLILTDDNPDKTGWIFEFCNDKKFIKKFKSLFKQEWEYIKFIKHPKTFCKEKNLIIKEDLDGLIAGYYDNERTKPYSYSDSHPSYNGHKVYGKYLSEKIQEWY
tara:strand:- start:18341 stop:19228 length:888 start_codon:yes stop_codon:yes gene_type:complete